jgi:acetolactate synthase I/II/III large subunit
VCVIGTPVDFRLRVDAKLVHIHADATRLGRDHAPDAGIVGDSAAVLGILADGVRNVRVDREPWLDRVRKAERAWWDEHRAELESDASPIRAYRLANALDDVVDPGTIVIGDGGDVVAAVSRVLRVHRPGHWLDAGPFGCLGIGAPYALGAKAAKPEKQVVVVSGDGAFGLGFEYETLVHLGLPAVFVIGNDTPTRYERLAETFGGHGEHVERPDRLAPALERALASGEPAIVNVLLDPQGWRATPTAASD